MFDAVVLARPLPEGSFFALLAEHGDRIVRDEDFAECYSACRGRPAIAPSLLAKVMLLQHRCGLSDEAAMQAVGWDLRWKIALGLAIDHEGWHPTSLTKFRARLLLHGKEALALENTLRLAEEVGLLDGTAEQIIDSTPMLGAAATQDTVRLVRHGVRKLLDAVAAVDEQTGERLDDGLDFDYARPNDKPDCRWREKAERERMLTRVAQDAECALRAVERADDLLDDDGIADAHRLLRELIGQDFDVDDDGVPRLHRGTASDRIISTVDREMRHGRKSQHQRFDGYKLSASVTNTLQPLITAIAVAPASEQDGPQAAPLIDGLPESRRPQRVLGDTAYGTGPVRAQMAERDVDVLAPVPPGAAMQGRLAKRDFHIDLDTATVTCPAGQHVAIGTEPSGQRRALLQARLRRLRAAQAVHQRTRRPAGPHRTRRRTAARRSPSARGPRHGRTPAPPPTADRAAAQPARSPLRGPQEPLLWLWQNPTAGRLGRRTGQPQPDRPPPDHQDRLTAT